MKRIVSLVLLVSAAFAFHACSSPASGPEKAAKEAAAAFQKGDYDAYAATFDLPESDQKMLSGMIEEKAKDQVASKGGIQSYKVVDSTIDGDEATVDMLITYKDGTTEESKMYFVQKDGKWLQVFKK